MLGQAVEWRMGKIDRINHFNIHHLFVITFLVIFLAGTLAIIPTSAATDPTPHFSATIAPTSTNIGTTTVFTITITNNGPPNLQSAQIKIPSGFSTPASVAVTTSNSKHWSYAVTSTTISLNSGGTPNQVPQNRWIKAVFSSKASTAGSYTWTCQAWNGNPAGTGTAFTLSGSQPTVTVSKAYTTTATKLNPHGPITFGDKIQDRVTITTSASGSLPSASGTWKVQASQSSTFATGVVTVGSGPVSGSLQGTGFVVTTSSWAPTSAGTWYFRANYSGDSNYMTSQSANNAETLTVDKAPSTITVTASPNPFDKSHPTTVTVFGDLTSGTTSLGGETVTLSYNVGVGWVTFDIVKTTSAGTYSSTKLPVNSLPMGPCYIKAVFAGDCNYEGSSTTICGSNYKLEVLPEYLIGGALLATAACFAGFVVFKKRSNLSHLRLRIK